MGRNSRHVAAQQTNHIRGLVKFTIVVIAAYTVAWFLLG